MTRAGCLASMLLLAACDRTTVSPDDVAHDDATQDGPGATDASTPQDATTDIDATDDAQSDTDVRTGDARVTDQGPERDAGSDTSDAGTGCDVPHALVCDSFETGAIDPAKWRARSTRGTLTVDSVHASDGHDALHAHVLGMDASEAALHYVAGLPVAGNHLFGRLSVYFAHHLPDADHVVLEASGDLGGSAGMARYGIGGVNAQHPTPSDTGQRFRLAYHPGDYSERSTSVPALDHWSCWQWEMDGSTNTMRLWADGGAMPEVVSMHETPAWVAPRFDDLFIGFRVPHADSRDAYDVWIDDVVVATARVGCPAR